MKSFKELLSESVQNKKFAKTVELIDRNGVATSKGQIGFLHFAHGSDYDVYAPDSHDLAYFGKGVVRLKGKTTGKTQAAYIDWAKGTVSFYSGDPADDLKFDKPAKFKGASLYKEAEENLDLYNQLAEDFEIDVPMDEALVKGKVYKLPSNDMRLLYTGRTKNKPTGEYAVFTVVDASGKPRLVSGKRFTQEYKGDMLSKLVLAESEQKLSREMVNTLNGIKDDLKKGKRSVKSIAQECATMEKQVHDDYSKSVLARLSDCKNRKEFETVLNSVM